jgi:RNA polymerase sigma-70 factor (ECF subfamily)
LEADVRHPLCEALTGEVPRGGWAPSDALEALLVARLAEARGAWPKVLVEPTRFAAWVGAHIPAGGDEAALERVHTSDLYLACACADGDPRALAAFEQAFLSQVPAYIARVDRSPQLADDVRQALRERLLLGGPDVRPRIAEYAGNGALGAWVRVAATRLALNQRRGEARAARPLGDAVAGSAINPELDYIKLRYAKEFAAAFKQTIAELPARERAILSLYFLEGMSSAAIGELYDAHGATVRRWIERLRVQLLEDTRRRLVKQLGIDTHEFDSLMNLVRSRIDLHLSQVLRKT